MEPEIFSVLGALKGLAPAVQITLILAGLTAWAVVEGLKLRASRSTANSVKVVPDALVSIKNMLETHIETTGNGFKEVRLEILALDGKIEAVHKELKEHKSNDHKSI